MHESGWFSDHFLFTDHVDLETENHSSTNQFRLRIIPNCGFDFAS